MPSHIAVHRQNPSRPSWAIGAGEHEGASEYLVVDATSLLDAVHENLEPVGNVRRQVYERALGHAHRMPVRVARKLV